MAENKLFCFEIAVENLLNFNHFKENFVLKFQFLNFAPLLLFEGYCTDSDVFPIKTGKSCFFATNPENLESELAKGALSIFVYFDNSENPAAGAKIIIEKMSNEISFEHFGLVRLLHQNGTPFGDLKLLYRLTAVSSGQNTAIHNSNFPPKAKLMTEQAVQVVPTPKSTNSALSQTSKMKTKERQLQTKTKRKTRQTQTNQPESKEPEVPTFPFTSKDLVPIFGRFLKEFLPKNREEFPVLHALCNEMDSATLVNDVDEVSKTIPTRDQPPSRHQQCFERIYGGKNYGFNIHSRIQSAKSVKLYTQTKTSAQRFAYSNLYKPFQTGVRQNRARSAPSSRIILKDTGTNTENGNFENTHCEKNCQTEKLTLTAQTQTEILTKTREQRVIIKESVEVKPKIIQKVPTVSSPDNRKLSSRQSTGSYSADFTSEMEDTVAQKPFQITTGSDSSEADSINTQIRTSPPPETPSTESSSKSTIKELPNSSSFGPFPYERRGSQVPRLPSIDLRGSIDLGRRRSSTVQGINIDRRRSSIIDFGSGRRRSSIQRQKNVDSPPMSPVSKYLVKLRAENEAKKGLKTPSPIRTESVSSYMPSDLEMSPQ